MLAGCALLILLLVVGGCGDHPEALLVGRWQESGWEYEKPATKAQAEAQWIEGLALPEFSERLVVHHEAEYWDFRPDGRLVIAKRDGTQLVAHWRLKGRGHVLTVSSPEEGFEVYDVKGLDRDELVLNFDVGMEVRGIARLTFKRVTDNTALREARRAPLSFVSPGH